MTTDAMELMRKIENVDTEAFADVLVDTVFGNPADPTSGFEGYEAAKGLQSIVRNCESAHEFEIVNNTCIAIFGWSVETLVNGVGKSA